MLIHLNKSRRLTATRCALTAFLATSLAAVLSLPARAQVAIPAPAAIQQPGIPLSPDSAMAAFHACATWLSGLGKGDPDPSCLITTPAAAVTLRRNGTVVGRGVAIGSSPDDNASLAQALREAWADASPKLNVEHDALSDERRAEAVRTITLSIELAEPWIPETIDEFKTASLRIAPGREGVAIRIQDKVAATFPDAMLAQGSDPGAALAALAARLTGTLALTPGTAKALANQSGAVYYRFATVHLAQPGLGQEPIFLTRGARAHPRPDLPQLLAFADAAASHLLARAWPGPEAAGLIGLLEPTKPSKAIEPAGPAEQAAAVIALRRYAQTPGVNATTAQAASNFADRVLQALTKVEPGETPPDARADVAAVVLAAILEPRDASQATRAEAHALTPEVVSLASRCRDRVDHAWIQAGTAEARFASEISPGGRPLVALALALRAKEAPTNAAARDLARAALGACYAQAEPSALAGDMPWIVWAEQALASVGAASPTAPLLAAPGLREARRTIWDRQLQRDQLDDRALDMVGGIAPSPEPTGALAPLATWHSARALAGTATMLRDPRLTKREEFAPELIRQLSGLRFLRQLMTDDAVAYMFENPAKTLGAVRSAPWDQRLPLDATSLSLIAACETIHAIDNAAKPAGTDRPGTR